jgi:hypothetical protein
MNKPYMIFVNGILAERRMTRATAVQVAMRFFPSYIVDVRTNAVVWNGGK